MSDQDQQGQPSTGTQVEKREQQEGPGAALALRGAAATPMMEWMAKQAGVNFAVMSNGLVAWSIPPELEQGLILLTPKAQIAQVNENFTPLPAVVQIDLKRDVYKVGYKDNQDELALTSRALAQIAKQAGIEHVNTRRVHFPGGMETIVTVKYLKEDGTEAHITKSKVTDFGKRRERVIVDALNKRQDEQKLAQKALDAGMTNWPEGFQKGREINAPDYKLRGKPIVVPPDLTDLELRTLIVHDQDFQAEKDETKAFSRCVRAIMGAQTYPRNFLEQRNGRFFLVRYVFTPDYSDASTRHLVDAKMRGAVTELYGDGAIAEIEAAPIVTETGPKDVSSFAVDHDRQDRDADVPDEDEVDGHRDVDVEPGDDEPEREPAGDETGQTSFDPPPGFDQPQTQPAGDGNGGGGGEAVTGSADDWEPPEPPKSDHTFERGPLAGKPLSEIVFDGELRNKLEDALPKMRNQTVKDLATEWIGYADEKAEWDNES